MATLGDKVKSWIPLIVVASGVIASSAVGAYKLDTLKDSADSKVSKDTYEIQLADVKSSHAELKDDTQKSYVELNTEVEKIKTTQQQQTAIKVRQEYMKEQIESSNKKIESLDKKMDDKFDDLKDFIRGNIKR